MILHNSKSIVLLFIVLGFIAFSGCSDSEDSTPDSNSAPTADAGIDQHVKAGVSVRLDGSKSNDADHDVLTYNWKQISGAHDCTLNDPGSSHPTIQMDFEGVYSFELIVNDGKVDSTADTVTVTVTHDAVNSRPVANAGIDQHPTKKIDVPLTVTLDGSKSSDADHDLFTYRWTVALVVQDTGVNTNITLNNPTLPNPTFVADQEGYYVVGLIVNDGTVDSVLDGSIVNVLHGNSAPVANSGENRHVTKGVGAPLTVALDGTKSSDADHDKITYKWRVIFVSLAATYDIPLNDPTLPRPTFVADEVGNYLVTLIVNDGKINSDSNSGFIAVSEVNSKPLAYAGIDQHLSKSAGETLSVALDGSKSYDADNNIRDYNWTVHSKPPRSSASFDDVNSTLPKPKFMVDTNGTYVLKLIVTDANNAVSLADTVTLVVVDTVTNSIPVADAGIDQHRSKKAGETLTVKLDGSKSSDADADGNLAYSWTVKSVPKGSNASLKNPTWATPTFDADIEGSYVFKLIVNDGTVDSAPDGVTVKISHTNSAPVSNAGVDKYVSIADGETLSVTLDGSKSSDADHDRITYKWTVDFPLGTTGYTLTNSTSVNPTLEISKVGQYILKLVVNDGTVDSFDGIVVQVSDSKSLPVANAGDDQDVTTGDLVKLDGSGSQAQSANGMVFYKWHFVSKPPTSNTTLLDSGTSHPTFNADVNGTYVINMGVSDDMGNYNNAQVTVTANPAHVNTPPVANAGDDQKLSKSDGVDLTVYLDAAKSSDADHDHITYSWTVQSVPPGSTATLTNSSGVKPTFDADIEGSYVFKLIVNDSIVDSAPSTVIVTVSHTNSAPVANAGIDQHLSKSAGVDLNVTLDGSQSHDDDGHLMTFSWTVQSQPTGSSVTSADLNLPHSKIVVDTNGTYVFKLIVTDENDAVSLADTVTVVVKDSVTNSIPVADAGIDQHHNVSDGEYVTITLNGLKSHDDDNDTLTYKWEIVHRPGTSTLKDANTSSPHLLTNHDGDFVFKLIVNDGTVDSVPVMTTVKLTIDNARPTSNVDTRQLTVSPNTPVLLETTSSDPDNDKLTYKWVFRFKPAGSVASLSDYNVAEPNFTADTVGQYWLMFQSNDGKIDSNQATQQVLVQ